MSVSFAHLLRQYESLEQEKKVFLVRTPQGPLFVVRNFFFRICDVLFRGYSYDRGKASDELLGRAKNLLEKMDSCPESELEAALKVMKICEKILLLPCRRRWFSFFSSSSSASSNIQPTIHALAEALGKKRGLATIEVLAQFKCYSEILAIAKEGKIPKELPRNILEPALSFACKQSDKKGALALLEENVPTTLLQEISPSFFHEIASWACIERSDKALARLVEEHKELSRDGPLCFLAAQQGLLESIKKFIHEKIRPIDYIDSQGNTVLHAAFLSCNASLARYLLQFYDPFIKNHSDHTPLEEMLSFREMDEESPSFEQKKAFLQDLLRPEKESQNPALRFDDVVAFTTWDDSIEVSANQVEALFLSQTPLDSIPATFHREKFEAALPYLQKKYPKADTNEFLLSAYLINRSHLKTGYGCHVVPSDVPGNFSLQSLLSLFDGISWEAENISKCYRDMIEENAIVPENALALLREQLEGFIRKIRRREEFLGTPKRGAALEAFYSKIELCLRHTGAKLAELRNNDTTVAFMGEILRASKYCGGRIFQTAVNQYYRLCHGIEESSRDILERLLADYRRICFEGVVNELYHGDVHALTQASKELGEELGIPGAGDIFHDRYIDPLYNKAEVRKLFFEKAYTPYAIVFHHLIPTLNEDDATRDVYIDLQKEVMPPTWNDEKYAAAYRELGAIPRNVANRIKEEDAILEKYDVVRGLKQTAAQAIEEDRKAEYLRTFVHDAEGKRTLQGLLFLLERIGIFQGRFPWQDPSREIAPLARKSLFWEKLKSLFSPFSRLGNTVHSLFSW